MSGQDKAASLVRSVNHSTARAALADKIHRGSQRNWTSTTTALELLGGPLLDPRVVAYLMRQLICERGEGDHGHSLCWHLSEAILYIEGPAGYDRRKPGPDYTDSPVSP